MDVAKKPAAFLLENVPGLKECDQGVTLRTIVHELEGAGYTVHVRPQNARTLTAQTRNRLFFAGFRRNDETTSSSPFRWPFVPSLGLCCADVLETEEELVSTDDDAVAIENCLLDRLTLTNSQFEHLTTKAKLWKPSKLAWGERAADTIGAHYGVSVGNGNSQLVPRSPPHNPRRFSPKEVARLMGFPVDGVRQFRLGQAAPMQGVAAHQKSLYRMLGNAVAPPLIAVLAAAVLDAASQCNMLSSRDSCLIDWPNVGSAAAVRLALRAVTNSCRGAAAARLVAEGVIAAPASAWIVDSDATDYSQVERISGPRALNAVEQQLESQHDSERRAPTWRLHAAKDLNRFVTAEAGWICSGCTVVFPAGTVLFGCRRASIDYCGRCHHSLMMQLNASAKNENAELECKSGHPSMGEAETEPKNLIESSAAENSEQESVIAAPLRHGFFAQIGCCTTDDACDTPSRLSDTSLVKHSSHCDTTEATESNGQYTLMWRGVEPAWSATLIVQLLGLDPSFEAQVNLLDSDDAGTNTRMAIVECSSLDAYNRAFHCDGLAVPMTHGYCYYDLQPLNSSPNASVASDRHSDCEPPLALQLAPLPSKELLRRLSVHNISPGTGQCGGKLLKHLELVALLADAYQKQDVMNPGGPRLVRKVLGAPLAAGDLSNRVLASLRECTEWPARDDQRKGVAATNYLTLKRKDCCGARPVTSSRAELWALCAELIDPVAPDAVYNALALTKNFRGSPHIDEHDSTHQYVIALGNFSGGAQLWSCW
eukprot:SAG31_NODE_59_length_29571_cov_20.443506_31_plen_767_part_00